MGDYISYHCCCEFNVVDITNWPYYVPAQSFYNLDVFLLLIRIVINIPIINIVFFKLTSIIWYEEEGAVKNWCTKITIGNGYTILFRQFTWTQILFYFFEGEKAIHLLKARNIVL